MKKVRKKIIVTGASGFIGRNFLLKSPKDYEIYGIYHKSKDFIGFLDENNLTNVKAMRCDLTSKESILSLRKKISGRIDIILFLSGNSIMSLSLKNPVIDLTNNVYMLINFLTYFKCRKFIYVSSGSIYEGLKGPINVNSRVCPLTPYGISKLAAECFIKYFHKHIKNISEYVILRIFGVYGPYDYEWKFYTRLVKELYLNRAGVFTVQGDGNNIVDYLYVEDFVSGLKSVINSRVSNLTVNFTNTNNGFMTLNQIISIAASTFKIKNVRILHRGVPIQYNQFYASKNDMADFNFKPSFDLKRGLRSFAEYLSKTP